MLPLPHSYTLFANSRFGILYMDGAVVSMFDYESTGLSSILDEGRRRTAHPDIRPPKWVGR